MNVLVVLIPVSLLLAVLGLIGFLWTIRAQQYEDPLGQASRILLNAADDESGKPIEHAAVATRRKTSN